MAENRESPQRTEYRTEHREVHEYTTPLWRVVAAACGAGIIFATGKWLETVGHVDDFATMLTVAIGMTVLYWAKKRPDRMKLRLGVFDEFGQAALNLHHRLDTFAIERPLRIVFFVFCLYGLLLVLARSGLVFIFGLFLNLWIAIIVGCGVGALAAAPHTIRDLAEKLQLPAATEPDGYYDADGYYRQYDTYDTEDAQDPEGIYYAEGDYEEYGSYNADGTYDADASPDDGYIDEQDEEQERRRRDGGEDR